MNKMNYLFFALVLSLFSFTINEVDFGENFPLYLAHVFIGIISVIIVTRKDCGMFTQAAGIFFFIFFSIFPIYELSNQIIYWGGNDLTRETRLLGVFMIFLFVLFFWAALHLKLSSSNRGYPSVNKLFAMHAMSTQSVKWLLVLSVSGLLILFQLFEFQIFALFVKGGEFGESLNVETKAAFLFVEFFLRPMIFNMGLVYILLGPKNILFRAFFVLAMLFAASPSGVSRFLVAALYIPLILIIFMMRRNKKQVVLSQNFYLFPNILLLGLFFIFPFLEVFRYFSSEKFSSFSLIENQQAGHFDAFQMFLRALDVGSVNYGYGFLGVVLFFIPRSLWPTKPVTSGIEISWLSDLRLENVSMPLMGELYLNFWYFGIILGAPLIALLFKKIDSYYLRYKCSNLSLGHLMYFQLASLVIYNMRGGLLSSFAYTISIVMTWLLLILLLSYKPPNIINK